MPISKRNPKQTTYGGKVKKHKSAAAAKVYSMKMKKKKRK
jgi:hypothetical protein